MNRLERPVNVNSHRPAQLELVAVGVIAMATAAAYVVFDRQPPFWDEYYHLLAARSWAADGTLTVGGGEYARQAWFSVLTGWVFRTFGEGLEQARAATVLTHTAWVMAVFAWLRRETGRTSAWVAALLLALSPWVLVHSVMVRFYGFNALLVTLGALGLYVALNRDRSAAGRLAALMAAALCLWLSYRVSPLTRVWVSGLLGWALATGAWRAARSRYRVPLLALMVLGCAAWAGWLWGSGWFAENWRVYRSAPGWRAGRANAFAWYAYRLREDYPTLLTLFPLAALAAIARKPRLGGMCTTAFVVALVLLSGAAPKSERYFVPLLSFFFMVWGVAVAEFAPVLLGWGRRAVDDLLPEGSFPSARKLGPGLVVATVLAFVLVTNDGFTRVAQLPRGQLARADRTGAQLALSYDDWESAADGLRALVGQVDVVVSPNSLQMLYHVGACDYEMRPTVIHELEPPEEFGIDTRTGMPGISLLASLRAVMAEHDTGIVVGERFRWGHAFEGLTPDVAAFVYEHLVPVPVPGAPGLVAYRWERDTGDAASPEPVE